MIIDDITEKVMLEFGRIATTSAPDPDDGGGNFLTDPNVLGFMPMPNDLTSLYTIGIVPWNQIYTPHFVDMSGVELESDYDIHGFVSADTGTTNNAINAGIECNKLINDCLRVARTMFITYINTGADTRFQIIPGSIKTAPIRLDANHYRFMFSLNFRSEYVYTL